MASTSETGHSINISNFKLLIDKCAAFATQYNPSNADLTIANMTTLWTTGGASHTILTKGIQDAKGPIANRQILFNPTDKFVTHNAKKRHYLWRTIF